MAATDWYTTLDGRKSDRVEMVPEAATNTLNMPITLWYVKLDGLTIGEFRNRKWAVMFAEAVQFHAENGQL